VAPAPDPLSNRHQATGFRLQEKAAVRNPPPKTLPSAAAAVS
jgi:hypothetical protein